MFKRRLRLPSPAIVIAMIALALVLGGTAIAAGTSTPLTKGSATKLIKQLAPTLTVKHAMTADGRADGYASSTVIDNFTSSSFTSIASKTFKAPAAGYAFISATLSTEADDSLGSVGRLRYTLALDGSLLEKNSYAHEITTDGANGIESGSGAITEVVPVTKGTHSVDLMARESASGDYIESRQISIIYFANGSASAVQFAPRSNAANNPSK